MASRNNRVFSLPRSVMDSVLFPESRAFCEDLFLEVSVSGSVKTSSEAGSLQGDDIRSESDLDSEGSFNEITSVGTGSFVENATLEFDSLDLGYPGLSCSMEAIFTSADFNPSRCISAPEMAETVVNIESPSEFRMESLPDRKRYYHTVWVEDAEIPETVFETLPANSVVVVHSSVTKEIFTPPDGGFGWVVVAATFLISFLLSGFVKSLSAFPVAIFEEFPAATAEEVAWITNLISGFSLLFSPLTGALITKFGFGSLVLIGGLLCSAGLGISYFATSAGFLIGSLGAFVGIGASLAVTSSIVCVARYFTTKRPLAMALALSGGCVGALVLSPGLTAVISSLGLRYAFLVLAGVFHLISVSSLVFGTPEKRFRREVMEIPLAEMEDISEPLEDIGICTKIVRSVSEALGLHYFKECRFLVTAASVFAVGMGITHLLQYIPQQARSLGIEESPATMLIFYAGVSDLVIRLSYGLLASRSPFPRTVEYTASIVISTTSIVLIPFCTAYWHLIVTSVLAGVGSGLWTILIPLLLSGIHGVENLCSTLSLVRLFQGCTTLIFPTVVSAIQTRWGTESVLIFAVSKMSIAGVLSLVLLLLIQVRNKSS